MAASGPIRGVVFDAVGTLIHPSPSAPEVYADAAARFGLNLTAADVRHRFVAAFREQEAIDAANGWETSESREVDRWRRIVAEALPGVPDPDGCFEFLYRHYEKPEAWVVDPQADRVFVELSALGLRIGLGSNYDSRLETVIDGHPALTRLRPHIVISSLIGTRKPSADFFHHVERSVGLPANELLFVGDDPANDYHGATAAGFAAVLLDPADRHPQVPHRIHHLTDLLPRIAG